MSYDASRDERYHNKYEQPRTELSRRRQQLILEQRVLFGDLRPGQRSLNDGS